MGWKKTLAGLFGSQKGKAGGGRPASGGALPEFIDTSWSGHAKGSFRHFDPYGTGNKEGSSSARRQYHTSVEARTPTHQHSGRRPPRAAPSPPPGATSDQAGLLPSAAEPVTVGAAPSAADKAEGHNPELSSCSDGQVGSTCPSLKMHRSGSAPCTIDMSRRQLEAASDSASSIHLPEIDQQQRAAVAKSLAAGLADLRVPTRQRSRRGEAPAAGAHAPAAPQQQRQQQQQQQPTRRGSIPLERSTLSRALEQQPASPFAKQVAQVPSPEKPSSAILNALSRSVPSSAEPSVHGGEGSQRGSQRGLLAAAAAAAQQQQQRQQQQRQQQQHGEGEGRSAGSSMHSSGRPVSKPLPCSREGSQHGRHDAMAALSSLPPGEPAFHDEHLRHCSMPARCLSESLCSPGAVSLLSLQLRGASAAGSVSASREGSYRPLHRQVSAGGLSAALSREGSTRGMPRQSTGGPGKSQETSVRGGSLFNPDGALDARWQAPGASREGSSRGFKSREGSSRGWGALHPVAETGPYHPLPPHLAGLEGGASWKTRITSFSAGLQSGGSSSRGHPPLPGLERPGLPAQGQQSRQQPQNKQQQRYAVDATQLTAALSALALPQPPSPHASHRSGRSRSGVGGSSAGGSAHDGSSRKSVLVGDTEWATQEGDGLGLTCAGLPEGEPLTDQLDWQQGPSTGQLSQQHAGQGQGAQQGWQGAGSATGAGPSAEGPSGSAPEAKKDWNRKFIRRWKAVKKKARIQAMGLRSLWKVNSPSDVHEPDELLVDLPQNDMAWPRFWSPPRRRGTGRGGVPMGRVGSRADFPRDPSLANMLMGEVAEVT